MSGRYNKGGKWQEDIGKIQRKVRDREKKTESRRGNIAGSRNRVGMGLSYRSAKLHSLKIRAQERMAENF